MLLHCCLWVFSAALRNHIWLQGNELAIQLIKSDILWKMVIFRNSEIFSYLEHFCLLLPIALVRTMVLLLLRLRYFSYISLSRHIFVLSHIFFLDATAGSHMAVASSSLGLAPSIWTVCLDIIRVFWKISHSSGGWEEYCPRQRKHWSKGNLKSSWFFAQANLHYIFLYGCCQHFSLCFEVPRKRNTWSCSMSGPISSSCALT